MRIAVLISGQMRDSNVNYLNHLKCVIENNNADVFVTTSTKNFWYTGGNPNPLTYKFSLYSEYSKDEIQNILENYYGNYLKKFVIKENEFIPNNFGTPEYYSYFINNQFNNNREAYNLAKEYEIENNITYDKFVRLRIDKTVFTKITEIPKYNIPVVTHVEPCQFFFIGNRDQMDHYCNFKYLENYTHKEGNTFANKLFPHPPDEIRKHIMKKYKIKIINNILTIYQEKHISGRIGEFPFIQKKENQIGWNANGLCPK